MGLSDGRKRFRIGLAVLMQYRSVTASHPASQQPSHVAVAITLNAKASSLKSIRFSGSCKIIEKLNNNNINCKLIKWIAAFLQDTKMQVKVKLKFSDWAAVLSGVPQGAVLGPLLFLIFVNELPLWIRNTMILMYADDTKVSHKISNENDGAVGALLHHDLDSLMEWSKKTVSFGFQH